MKTTSLNLGRYRLWLFSISRNEWQGKRIGPYRYRPCGGQRKMGWGCYFYWFGVGLERKMILKEWWNGLT